MRTHPFTVLAALTSMTLFGLTSVAVEKPSDPVASETSDTRENPPVPRPSRTVTGQLVVTPDNEFTGSLNLNDPSEVASFTVEYQGNELDDPTLEVTLNCQQSGPIMCESISQSSPMTLYLNTPENVDITFSTGASPGVGTVTLFVNGPLTNTGSRLYQVGPPIQVNELTV